MPVHSSIEQFDSKITETYPQKPSPPLVNTTKNNNNKKLITVNNQNKCATLLTSQLFLITSLALIMYTLDTYNNSERNGKDTAQKNNNQVIAIRSSVTIT